MLLFNFYFVEINYISGDFSLYKEQMLFKKKTLSEISLGLKCK